MTASPETAARPRHESLLRRGEPARRLTGGEPMVVVHFRRAD